MSKAGYLFDINVLVALIDDAHIHHSLVSKWFESISGKYWGVCALTEAGFLRVMTRPSTGCLDMEEATDILEKLAERPGYRFWALSERWSSIADLFEGRVFGHRQITDALLLGLAINKGGIFVTLDKATGHLAGKQFAENLLILE